MPGGVCSRGVCMPLVPREVPASGPRGVSALVGVTASGPGGVSQHAMGRPQPCEQNFLHALLKYYLASTSLRMVNMSFSELCPLSFVQLTKHSPGVNTPGRFEPKISGQIPLLSA